MWVTLNVGISPYWYSVNQLKRENDRKSCKTPMGLNINLGKDNESYYMNTR